jgi:hypothetical protein
MKMVRYRRISYAISARRALWSSKGSTRGNQEQMLHGARHTRARHYLPSANMRLSALLHTCLCKRICERGAGRGSVSRNEGYLSLVR